MLGPWCELPAPPHLFLQALQILMEFSTMMVLLLVFQTSADTSLGLQVDPSFAQVAGAALVCAAGALEH